MSVKDDFLLKTEYGKKLYKTVAALPIIDYHCHIPASVIANDVRFADLSALMLGADHYKWRAMRIFGVDERFITGDADPKEKFLKYAETLEYALGNPLTHWTSLELSRVFGVDVPFTRSSAAEIFDHCTDMLQKDSMSAKNLIRSFGVEVICTTDDPLDSLCDHKKLRDDGFEVKVLPTFRPDKCVNIEKRDFLPYIKSAGVQDLDSLCELLRRRLDFFCENGCRVSDHGLDRFPSFAEGDAHGVFEKALSGKELCERDTDVYKTYMLRFLGKEYAKRGIAMQLHVGVLRNNSSRAFASLGVDSGFDSMDDRNFAASLMRFLDSLDAKGVLPKTVLYSLNPKDNYMLAASVGNFTESGVRSKIQFGSAWWQNDHYFGIRSQLLSLSELGVLGTFVGMLTDSRSLISYTRHEYFRRILCDLLGEMAQSGLCTSELDVLSRTAQDVSYYNALNYFSF